MKIFIFGAGAHASEVSELLQIASSSSPIFLTEKDEYQIDMSLKTEQSFYFGIGDPNQRLKIGKKWKILQNQFKVLRHPNTLVSPSSEIEEGSVLQFGSVVSSSSVLGFGVLLNWNVTVGHHSKIGDCTVINPGASVAGNCTIGEGVLIGTGARVLEGLNIGANAKIGAGAVVTRDVPAFATYVGIPARAIK